MTRRRPLLATLLATLPALAAGLLPAACASPDPVLYTLAETPGTALPGGPRTVALRQVSLARYLDRPQIVRSAEDFQLGVAQNDWWGEPLDRMIGRVLVADLSTRLPGSIILPETGAITAGASDATLEVNILGFAGDRAGNVTLSAQAAVTKGNQGKARASRAISLSAPAPSPDIKGQVAAMSLLLGRLADAVAEMLRQ